MSGNHSPANPESPRLNRLPSPALLKSFSSHEFWPLPSSSGLSLAPKRGATAALHPPARLGDTCKNRASRLRGRDWAGRGALPVFPLLQNLHGVQALRFLDGADPALLLLQLQDGRGLPRRRLRHRRPGHCSRGRLGCCGGRG